MKGGKKASVELRRAGKTRKKARGKRKDLRRAGDGKGNLKSNKARRRSKCMWTPCHLYTKSTLT